MMNLKILQP